MRSLLHVALIVDADTGIDTVTASPLAPLLRLGDHPRVIDIDLPSDPERAAAFLARLADTAIRLAEQLGQAQDPANR
jgi:hypothetical protein